MIRVFTSSWITNKTSSGLETQADVLHQHKVYFVQFQCLSQLLGACLKNSDGEFDKANENSQLTGLGLRKKSCFVGKK